MSEPGDLLCTKCGWSRKRRADTDDCQCGYQMIDMRVLELENENAALAARLAELRHGILTDTRRTVEGVIAEAAKEDDDECPD